MTGQKRGDESTDPVRPLSPPTEQRSLHDHSTLLPQAGESAGNEHGAALDETDIDPADRVETKRIIETKVRYFGDYELLEEIARGGMGVVYKARQMSLNRVVALKMILSGQLASAELLKRFRTEAQAAANLKHPNIVAIHEVGEHDGQHFFSMDYIEGSSLAELIRQDLVSAKQAAEYVRTIAIAIQYAHERHTLHRDLKPSNILIDSSGQPFVTDFGLAKRIEDSFGLTAPGQVLGTPSFMPPEQASGRLRHIGPHSDVYALGAVLYACLTSRPPFHAANPMEILIQVLEQEPVSPRDLNPSIPEALEEICLKCLQKNPSERYSSAKELAEELDRYLKGKPIHASPVNFLGRLLRWCRRPVRG